AILATGPDRARHTALEQHRWVVQGHSLNPYSVARVAVGYGARTGRFGVLRRHAGLSSRYVTPHPVDVWLPPHYQDTPSRLCPVLNTHERQCLFDPQTSCQGVDWGIDEAMRGLTTARRARAAIVVGIWNTPQRSQEYMPQRPLERVSWSRRGQRQIGRAVGK